MYQLIVGLEGGLGNRMRTAAATAAIAPHLRGKVAALWTSQWGMECRFSDLFEPYTREGFVLRDATYIERIIAARPRPRNLFLPRLTNRLSFRQVLYNEQVLPLFRENFDFTTWANAHRSLLWTWWDFYPWTNIDLNTLFRPLPTLQQRINERCASFTTHNIGVHIRRTDNQQSINESPIDLFYQAIDQAIERYTDTRVYVATDDEPTKAAMRQRYGNQRIITAVAAARRDSVSGLQDAVVEMWTLAATSHIYGSAGSSFSEIAARLGHTPFTILSNKNQKT